ncbi:MAG: class I SAM-dependent methyltransferase [Phycisphaerae bacterium]|nr:class I SAM-dependent methyltransferase [Phycisphaerae bacterium]
MTHAAPQDLFRHAEAYDRSINWKARLDREMPLLSDILGPPGLGGVLDAGCGTGRHAVALAGAGYRVTGADASPAMLEEARKHAEANGERVTWRESTYAELSERCGGGFDGIICVGNSLSAAGTRGACVEAVEQFSKCLRVGGRLFVQILNFPLMRDEHPCVRGPRVATLDGVTYISVRNFHFEPEAVIVVNTTLWQDAGRWQMQSRQGRVYPLELEHLREDCARAGMRIDGAWGSYDPEPFDARQSNNLLIAATRC